MNFLDTFLKLTEYTITYGQEHLLKPYLPENHIEDGCGNYYVVIGKSRTCFTCHMDTASWHMEKVNHVIDGNYIRSDGTTILGSDDKNGMTILLYMIERNIPGTYYFFAGEESGMAGAHKIISKNKNFFSDNFDRMVSFDRRGYDSVITHQMGRRGCTDEFGDALAKELNKSGLNYYLDRTGIYTDSASFMGIIPNVTNLSCGYSGEHTHSEITDIEYVELLARAACRVRWERLPKEGVPKIDDSMRKYYYDDEDWYF